MTYRIKHCHYRNLDPAFFPQPALFTIYGADANLAAVAREAMDFPLIGEPVALKNYRVDCRSVPDELRHTLERYFPGGTFAYFINDQWTWRHNGTYEEMPW